MRGEAFDLSPRPLDHRFKVDDELFVNRIVCGSERVERGYAGSVENPEHGELFRGVLHDEPWDARDSSSVTARLQLRASPPTAARNDVHKHDQRDDDDRSDGNDGNGGGGDDHADVLSAGSARKPTRRSSRVPAVRRLRAVVRRSAEEALRCWRADAGRTSLCRGSDGDRGGHEARRLRGNR
jgi:hypothetical protein